MWLSVSLLFFIWHLLQIERDTYGMLQCHPYPNEYIDISKQCAHCAFFMGLQRKQGVRVQEGQQFDIRGTVDEFRHSVNMYMYWKPGMEIYVSHVRRRQIPSFVFPEGFKRSRPSKPTNQQKSERAGGEDGDDEVEGGSPEKRLKRKRSPDEEVGKQQLEKRLFVSPDCEKLSSPEPGSGGSSEPGSGGSGGSSGVSIKVDRSPDNMQHAVAELDKRPTLISPGSGKQILPISGTGLCERILSGNGDSCEGGSSQDCVLAGIQETVLEAALLGSERVVENGVAEDLEVLHLTFPCSFLLFLRFMILYPLFSEVYPLNFYLFSWF